MKPAHPIRRAGSSTLANGAAGAFALATAISGVAADRVPASAPAPALGLRGTLAPGDAAMSPSLPAPASGLRVADAPP